MPVKRDGMDAYLMERHAFVKMLGEASVSGITEERVEKILLSRLLLAKKRRRLSMRLTFILQCVDGYPNPARSYWMIQRKNSQEHS